MTLPADNDTSQLHPQSSHYQPAPYNFSRPHLPLGSGSSTHSGHTLDGTPSSNGQIGVTGVLQGPKSPEGVVVNVNGRLPSGQHHHHYQHQPFKSPTASAHTAFSAAANLHPQHPQHHFRQHSSQTPDRDTIAATRGLGGFEPTMKNAPPMSTPPTPPSTAPASTEVDANSYFPLQNGSATRPSSIPVSINNNTTPVEHTPSLSPPPTSPSRLSTEKGASQPPLTGSVRQRHGAQTTLQVPNSKPGQGSRTSTPSGSDAVTSGRFSPTTTTTTSPTPRRHSMTLGRRPTRSIHSENHADELPPDEDAARWTEAIKAKRASRKRREDEEDDKVVVGTKVDHNHVNWVTAYNMLTGIRFCVSRINAKVDRDLTDLDFDAKHKFSFDV
jgi:hypothetical protein